MPLQIAAVAGQAVAMAARVATQAVITGAKIAVRVGTRVAQSAVRVGTRVAKTVGQHTVRAARYVARTVPRTVRSISNYARTAVSRVRTPAATRAPPNLSAAGRQMAAARQNTHDLLRAFTKDPTVTRAEPVRAVAENTLASARRVIRSAVEKVASRGGITGPIRKMAALTQNTSRAVVNMAKSVSRVVEPALKMLGRHLAPANIANQLKRAADGPGL